MQQASHFLRRRPRALAEAAIGCAIPPLVTRSALTFLTVAAPAVLMCGRAAAVLAPEYYEEARRSAPNHVQIEIEDVDSPSGGMGACSVEGKVVKVFRGDLAPGAELTFDVACYDYGAIPSGPTLWTDYDALSEAKYLEAFMSADPQPRIALDQVEIVIAPRDTPYCDSQSLYCESSVESAAKEDGCGLAGRIWNWLGIGAEECE